MVIVLVYHEGLICLTSDLIHSHLKQTSLEMQTINNEQMVKMEFFLKKKIKT